PAAKPAAKKGGDKKPAAKPAAKKGGDKKKK
ncbi:MAG TPA: histone, partial [Planctomycetaceae bacterium]|nr:histone [Planctomycetaceae bacterium]HCC99898.1 histone [Planctomycetaceae bacterium]